MKKVAAIGIKDFEDKLLTSERPILLACFSSSLFDQPDLEALTAVKEHIGDKLDIYKVLEEDKKHFATKFGIGGYPVYLLFFNGNETARFLGSATRNDIETFFLRHLKEANNPATTGTPVRK